MHDLNVYLDESRDHILAKFKIETRRASATVLIGHPKFVQGGFTNEEIASTLRTYNSHLSRIEVMHYNDLLDNAERDLALAASAPETEQEADRERLSPYEPANADPWAQSAPDPWSTAGPF